MVEEQLGSHAVGVARGQGRSGQCNDAVGIRLEEICAMLHAVMMSDRGKRQ
jgi:hypothetical protein